MDEHPKVALLIHGSGSPGVGQHFVNSMLSSTPVDALVTFSTTSNVVSNSQGSSSASVVRYQIPVSVLPVASSAFYWWFRWRHLRGAVRAMAELIATNSSTVVWATLNHPVTVLIARDLCLDFRVNLVAHLWDSPEYLARNLRLDPITTRHFLLAFADLMKNCSEIVTVSDGMSEAIGNQYNRPSRPMVFSPPASLWREPILDASRAQLSLIFAGSLYAYKEWNALLAALSDGMAEFDGVTIECVGNVSRNAVKPDFVRFEKILPQDEAANRVNAASIAYLPYWMDESHAYFVKTAFPSKLPFYVAAGTPVLFHGPEDSSPSRLLSRYRVGVSCHSHNPTEILRCIRELTSPEFLNVYKEQRLKALSEVFHPDSCCTLFEKTVQRAASGNHGAMINRDPIDV